MLCWLKKLSLRILAVIAEERRAFCGISCKNDYHPTRFYAGGFDDIFNTFLLQNIIKQAHFHRTKVPFFMFLPQKTAKKPRHL